MAVAVEAGASEFVIVERTKTRVETFWSLTCTTVDNPFTVSLSTNKVERVQSNKLPIPMMVPLIYRLHLNYRNVLIVSLLVRKNQV